RAPKSEHTGLQHFRLHRKCSRRCRDSNPRPAGQQPSTLITRPPQRGYLVDSVWVLICNDCSLLGEALLLLSGDVELNPGPMNSTEKEQMANIEKILLDVQSSQKTMLTKLAEIVAKQADLEQKIDTMIAKSNVIEERINIVEISARKIEAKLDDLENRSRRLNLVFFGVPDNEPKETWEKSESLLEEICSNVLKLSNIPIERAHRLGAFTEGRIRPIVATFSGWKARESVMRNAYKLKNTSFSVSEGFSHAVREKRRLLWNYAKEKRDSKGCRVRRNYDKLVINGKTFVWDSEMNQPAHCMHMRDHKKPTDVTSVLGELRESILQTRAGAYRCFL
ncbi:uncharacterized protein LOC142767157, partial [Rhipicephalus microplus]|uniref:uncharacterized protein LOC142767157 n=1 Tax=Rhipicephalus microplus TaxID=6941 RepID=UPI003F6B6027